MWRRAGLLVVLILAALVLSACGGGTNRAATLAGSSWPGITSNEDTAYVAFQTGVYAIDLDSCQSGGCEQLWQYSPASEGRTLLGGQQRVQFYAAPAFDDDIVVVGDYSEALHAIDIGTGEKRWTFPVARDRYLFGLRVGSDRARFVGGATIGEGIVYAGTSDGILYALDANDGEKLWTFQAENEIWDAPLLDEGVLYVSSLDHHLYAVDARNGTQVWAFEAEGALVSTPTLDEGILYFGAFDGNVYAIRAEDRQLIWKHEVAGWVWDSPAVADDLLVVGDLEGIVYGLRSENGSEVWQFQAEGAVAGTPLIDEGIAYVGSGTTTGQPTGRVYALDIESGDAIWEEAIEGEVSGRLLFFDTGTRTREMAVFGPLVLSDDTLLIGLQQGDDLLMAVNADTRAEAWELAVDTSDEANASAAESEDGEEQQPASQQLIRWLPIYLLMTVLMLMMMRRRQSE
jgi:outer membrane protein assembly factor BamB